MMSVKRAVNLIIREVSLAKAIVEFLGLTNGPVESVSLCKT